MPFKSTKQMRFLYAKKPKLAKRWRKKYGKKIKKQNRIDLTYWMVNMVVYDNRERGGQIFAQGYYQVYVKPVGCSANLITNI